MVKIKDFLDRYLFRLFRNTSDPKIIESINLENLHNLYRASFIVIVLDVISLLLYVATSMNAVRFWYTVFNVSCCLTACILVVVLSSMYISSYEKQGRVSNFAVNTLVYFFYILLSIWGAFTDIMHYKNGDQMLTFYIVQFCFICFIVMKPKIGAILITLTFSSLFACLYWLDGAVSIQFLNYVIFLAIAILGNALKYMVSRESHKNRLEILELNRILQQDAIIDDLTKIKNRKALDRDIDRFTGKILRVIMADIDDFKQYNDAYGHPVGDKVLSEVAAATKAAFEGGDTYRYGGDEFLIVLPNCSEAEFRETLKRWETAIGAIKIPGIDHAITCCYGVEHRFTDSRDDFKKCIKTADDRLYAAKKSQG